MQPDYMSMAQGQQTQGQPNIEEIKDLATAPEALEMPEGKDKESIKQRLIKLLETSGALQELKAKMSEEELMKEIDTLATAMEAGDVKSIRKSPLIPIFEGLSNAMMGGPTPSTGGPVPQQGAAPKDFASMMPPAPGGGMGGR